MVLILIGNPPYSKDESCCYRYFENPGDYQYCAYKLKNATDVRMNSKT